MSSFTAYLVALVAAALLPGGEAVIAIAQSRQGQEERRAQQQAGSAIVQNEAVRQTLRICNAYAHEGTMDINLARTGEAVGSLSYKDCGDFAAMLEEGDRLNFAVVSSGMLSAMPVGTFKVSDIQVSDKAPPLLLVVQRRGGQSLGAAFQSHAFAEGPGSVAQVAVLDAYQQSPEAADATQTQRVILSRVPPPGAGGDATASSFAQVQQQQDMPLNSVSSLQPGTYQASLAGQGGAGTVPTQFEAAASGGYVVLRVGAASAFPEELVVFPKAPAKAAQRPLSERLASAMRAATSWLR